MNKISLILVIWVEFPTLTSGFFTAAPRCSLIYRVSWEKL